MTTANTLIAPDATMSPRARARLAGVFEALEGTASAGGQVVILGQFVVPGGDAATAHNILAHETLFRFGFLLSLAGVGFHLAWGLLIYQVLKPVNRTVSPVAAFMVIITSAMQAVTALLYLAPLVVLKGGGGQAPGLAAELVKLNGAAFQVDLTFFGFWCVLTGYLVLRSRFLPRLLGVLLMVDGVGWSLYLWPPLATALFPAIAVAAGLAEVPMQVWLIVRGVNNGRWYEQAGISPATP
ncbi:DUF4386 domain-containing protein [Kutzneria buriramensis]|uniref:Uncharacterized protein DUF4386 n=1 Tax=Kutzneria buriramensis TaxID=1045776 RepID=A0A3E0HHL1_9PSEU|nr:DUF4386 domain-containing protein [Kutzneria buriramensis]REH45913.1 uncharacterized protein DUF4386 [Kutzneria buriramensis]